MNNTVDTGHIENWSLRLNPLLYSWIVPWGLYVKNVGEVSILDVLPILALLAAANLILAFLGRRIFRSTLKLELVLSVLWLLFFFYEPLHEASGVPHRYGALALFALIVLAIVGIRSLSARSKRAVSKIALTIAVVTLAVQSIGLMPVVADLREDSTAAEIPSAAVGAASRATDPDIYLIFLDAFMGEEGLIKLAGYDISPFMDDMAKYGFQSSKGNLTPYDRTLCTVSSVLDLALACHNLVGLPWGQVKRHLVRQVIPNARLFRVAVSRGYRIFSVETSPLVRFQFKPIEVHSYFGNGAYAYVLSQFTPLALWKAAGMRIAGVNAAGDLWAPDSITWGFDAIDRMVGQPSPKLVVAHIYLPHLPFYFDRNGEVDQRFKKEVWGPGHTPAGKMIEPYLDQVRFLQHRLMSLIQSSMGVESQPRVVLLFGDHGPRWMSPDELVPDPSLNRLNDFSALNSSSVPSDWLETSVSSQRSPVNTMITVLNAAWGLDLALVEESTHRVIFEGNSSPLTLERVE